MNKKILFISVIIGALLFAGTVLGLGGYFYKINPGANEVPHDTFTRGLVGYWDFDEGAGQTATDLSGNQNHGTLGVDSSVGNDDPTWTTDSPEEGGESLSFDGTDDYVIKSSLSPDFDEQSMFSISLWVNPSGNSGTDYFISLPETSGGENGIDIHWDGVNFKADLVTHSDNSIGVLDTSGSVDTWFYLALTYDGTTLKFYKNGVNVENDPVTVGTGIKHASKEVNIGRFGSFGSYFNGQIDQVRIYNRALSAEEIRYHYNRGGSVASWDFDEGSGSIAYDSTGNGNDGVLNHGGTGDNDSYSDMWVSGKEKTGIDFDGSNDYVDVSTISLADDTSWAVSMWIKPSVADATWRGLYGNAYAADEYTRVMFKNTTIYVYNDVNGNIIQWTGLSFTTNWQHIVIVHDYSVTDAILYIDGISKGNVNTGTFDTSQTIKMIGGYGSASSGIFNGQIDQVRVYDYARTAPEILLDYNKGKAAHFGLSTTDCEADPASCMDYGLVGNWGMDEGAGQTATDLSGNQNHGTLGLSSGVDASDPVWTKSLALGNSKSQTLGGTALSFDGTDDYVDCGNDASLTSAVGTIELWAKLNTTNDDEPLLFLVESAWSDYLRLYRSNGYLKFQIEDGNSYVTNLQGPVNMNNTNWHHIVITQDGSAIKIYIDGINQSLTGTNSAYWTDHLTLTNSYIGKDSWQSSVNGTIDQVRVYNRALGAEEVRYHYNRGGPVASWDFDEGSGSIAYDSTGNGNDGVLNNMDNSDWVEGKDGTALDFDGSNDYVDVGKAENLNLLNNFTIASWFKKSSSADRYVQISRKGNGNGFMFGVSSSQPAKWKVTKYGVTDIYIGTPPNDTNWHYVVLIYSSTNGVDVYLDGALNGHSSHTTNLLDAGTNHFYIGRTQSPEYHNGQIDEVCVYSYARTAPEILLDYNKGKAAHFGLSETDCDKDPASCMDYGLVGYWGMDEGAGQTATDLSGNQNHGTLGSSSGADVNDPSWSKGQSSGGGLSFDGVDDYLTRADDSDFDFIAADAFSIEAWFKHKTISTNPDYILTKSQAGTNGGYKIYMASDGDIVFEIDDDSTWGPDDSVTTIAATYDDDIWHYLTAVKNGTTGIYIYIDGVQIASDISIAATGTLANDDALYIGIDDDASSNAFNGQIDQVRVYNRALSAEEVRYHYNRGGPVAEWKMNERTGAKIYDSTNNNNDGKLNFGAGANDSYEDMWQGASDNLGIEFDGTDDYVDCGSDSSLNFGTRNFSIDIWMKTEATAFQSLIGKTDHNTNLGYSIDMLVDGTVRMILRDSALYNVTTTATINDGVWHYISGVRDGDNLYLYIDGVLKGTDVGSSGVDASSTLAFVVGARWGNGIIQSFFNGQIDQVRIYNRALGASEILERYWEGKMVHP